LNLVNTQKCILFHFGFHYILNEFGQFYYGEISQPLMNETSCYEQSIGPIILNETKLLSGEIKT
jgi:hypothetical protein